MRVYGIFNQHTLNYRTHFGQYSCCLHLSVPLPSFIAALNRSLKRGSKIISTRSGFNMVVVSNCQNSQIVGFFSLHHELYRPTTMGDTWNIS